MIPQLAKTSINPYSHVMFNFIPKKYLDYNIYSIGKPGELGFGIATAPKNLLPPGFRGKPGHDDITSENYGNYLDYNDSEMCWIPKFYYHFEEQNISITDEYKFATEKEANESDYPMHRVFFEGQKERKGFFIDKYLNTNINNILVSKYNTTIAATIHPTDNEFPLDVGAHHGSIIVEPYLIMYGINKRKIYGHPYSVSTIYAMGAIRMLMAAHGAAADNTNTCAWYDPEYLFNYPSGPVIIDTIGENKCFSDVAERKNKPNYQLQYTNTYVPRKSGGGAGDKIEFTTHNGQKNGICDLRWHGINEYVIGIKIREDSRTFPKGLADNYVKLFRQDMDIVSSSKNTGLFADDTYFDNLSCHYFNRVTNGVTNFFNAYIGKPNSVIFSNGQRGDRWLKTGIWMPYSTDSFCDDFSVEENKKFCNKYFNGARANISTYNNGVYCINTGNPSCLYSTVQVANNLTRFAGRAMTYP